MDLKLQQILYALPTRTAWIIIGSCVAFWLVCLTGILTPPVSTPPNFTLFWFYAMLMLILASGLAAIGSAAALVLKRRGRPQTGSTTTPVPPPAAPEPAARDGFTGLGRILDDPENLESRNAEAAKGPGKGSAPARKAPKPGKRRR